MEIACAFVLLVFISSSHASNYKTPWRLRLHRTEDFERFLKSSKLYNCNPILLEDILYPFVSKNCYVILRNYLQMDFSETSIPMITQYMEPRHTRLNKKSINWIAAKYRSDNVPSEARAVLLRQNCSSRFFTTFSSWAICVTLNVTEWFMYARPGNCKITVEYVLPDYMLYNSDYYYPPSETFLKKWVLSVPQIYIFLPTTNPISELLNSRQSTSEVSDWVYTFSVKYFHQARTIFQFMVIVQFSTQRLTKRGESQLSVYQLRNTDLKPYLITHSNWTKLSKTNFGILDLTEDQHEWSMFPEDRGSVVRMEPGIYRFLLYCSNYARLRSIHQSAMLEQRLDRLLDAYAHMLQLLMGNFTYPVNVTHSCNFFGEIRRFANDGLQEKLNYLPKLNLVNYDDKGNISEFPIILLNKTLSNIRFVGCGYRGNSEFELSQLLIVFDAKVWIVLCGICVYVSLVISELQSRHSLERLEASVFEIYKVFIEQGNPFQDKALSSLQLRVISISALFVGIVLSNAYKSHNVYKMVQPRTPMTYDSVDDLIAANFTLYSRLGYVNMGLGSGQTVEWKTPYLVQYGSKPDIVTVFLSPVWVPRVILRLESIRYRFGQMILNHPTNSIGSHPNATRLLSDSLEFLKSSKGSANNTSQKKIQSFYMNHEENGLLNELCSCRKSAVFLPEILAVKYFKAARNAGFGKVSIGKQVFEESPVGINFRGMIPRSVTDRITSLLQSGVQQYWEGLFSFDVNKQFSSNNIEVVPVPLKGNILIIFALGFTGLLFSTVVFFFECWMSGNMYTYTYRYLISVMKNFFKWIVRIAQACRD